MSRSRSHCIIKKILPGIKAGEVDDELTSLNYEMSFIKSESMQPRRSQQISEEDMLKIHIPKFSNKPKDYCNNSIKVKYDNSACFIH
jgi:hypothetical protein